MVAMAYGEGVRLCEQFGGSMEKCLQTSGKIHLQPFETVPIRRQTFSFKAENQVRITKKGSVVFKVGATIFICHTAEKI